MTCILPIVWEDCIIFEMDYIIPCMDYIIPWEDCLHRFLDELCHTLNKLYTVYFGKIIIIIIISSEAFQCKGSTLHQCTIIYNAILMSKNNGRQGGRSWDWRWSKQFVYSEIIYITSFFCWLQGYPFTSTSVNILSNENLVSLNSDQHQSIEIVSLLLGRDYRSS